MKAKKAVFLTLISPTSKKRVERNISIVKLRGYELDIVCPYDAKLSSVNLYQIKTTVNKIGETGNKVALLRLYLHQIYLAFLTTFFKSDTSKKYAESMAGYTASDLQDILDNQYDLIVVEEIELLPIALLFRKKRGDIIVDLRDFYWRDDTVPSHLSFNPYQLILNKLAWAHHVLRKGIYKKYLIRADQVITVCEGHAVQLKKLLNIDAAVFRSTVRYYDHIDPVLRASNHQVQLVYHGAAYRRRGLDQLIDAVNQTNSKIHLHLYLTDPEKGYLDELRSAACGRVHFHQPIDYQIMVKTMNQYDAGIIFYPPNDSSLEHALPNKFFEYIQSRLAVISGPSFDMSKIIKSYGIGTVSDSFQTEDLIRSLNELNHEKINEWKMNTNTAAKKLSFENEAKRFSQLI